MVQILFKIIYLT